MKNIDVFFACSDAGVDRDGAKDGALLLSEKLELDVNNKVIISCKQFDKSHDKNDKIKNIEYVNDFNKRLYNKIISSTNKVLTIGGDHSISIASGLASLRKSSNLGIIWLDAHSDFNTINTTITGNIHGLPLAVLTNYEKDKLNTFHKGNYYKPENTVIIGARSIDKLEYQNLIDAGIKVFTTIDIKTLGIDRVVEEAIKIANNNTYGIHVSFDLDIIDPKYAPGVTVPEVNGISENEAYMIIDKVLEYNKLIKSFDIVEYNSLNDTNSKTYLITKNITNKVIEKL